MDEALKKMPVNPMMKPEKTGEVPYDFTRKRLSICIRTDRGNMMICKGAFNQIISICTKVKTSKNEEEDIDTYVEGIQQQYTEYGNSGLRVIGVCYKTVEQTTVTPQDEQQMTFSGFILLQDPVKTGITEARRELQSLDVDLKIITGDNRNVALSIGQQIGIKNTVVMGGDELEKLTDGELEKRVQDTHIFAEVEPQQKEKIILSLKKNFTVGYMGDGINDVAAINAADIGISVENATDVAREAADFVLMEKDLSVLAAGIREGRKTFANTLKYIYISTGSTFGNMCSMAIASFLLPFLPMLPKQILLTNFLTDFPYLAVASDNVDEEQTSKPGKWNIKIIRNYMLVFGIHSSVFDIFTFLILLYFYRVREASFQTGWFIESVLTELFILFIIRTHQNFFRSKPAIPLLWLTLIALMVTIALPYLPFAGDLGFVQLPATIFTSMLAIVLIYVITADLLKVWFFRRSWNQ
ncbi:HAD-IC family P-type ATPase [Daejeonia sp. YH14]|uniref:HAD-IC family P-type ATPase n=1 Tax=Daejeonia sp. YH14 TaxID=3439042 RepID=UPI003F49B2BF